MQTSREITFLQNIGVYLRVYRCHNLKEQHCHSHSYENVKFRIIKMCLNETYKSVKVNVSVIHFLIRTIWKRVIASLPLLSNLTLGSTLRKV